MWICLFFLTESRTCLLFNPVLPTQEHIGESDNNFSFLWGPVDKYQLISNLSPGLQIPALARGMLPGSCALQGVSKYSLEVTTSVAICSGYC